ncbi:MAG TPA: hypothetical protein VF021_12000 [Longimicrobiales bacterium]
MNRYRHLALPAYLVAAALVFIPIFDASMSVWPWRPGVEQWRFGALGLLSNAFMIPAAGLLIVLATALLLGHWRTLRAFGFVCAAGALLTMLFLVLFALDAVQTSASVGPEANASFVAASYTAAAKLLLAAVTLAGFAVAGLRTRIERPRDSRIPMAAVRGREAAATDTTSS